MAKNVTVVLQKGFEDVLLLWGVFKDYEKAVVSVENDIFHLFNVKLINVTENPDFSNQIVNEDQDWEAIVDASVEDPDAGDVWGYLITDRVQ